MKDKLTSDLKKLFKNATDWAKLESEYIKLTVAEKLTIFLTALALCSIFLLIVMVLLMVLAFCLIDLFSLWMQPWLACLAVGGALLILSLLIYLFRIQLVVNPISRFITKLLLSN